MSRLSIFIDIHKCTGCHNCFLACRDEYSGNDYPGYSAAQPVHDHFWLQIKDIERGTYPKPKLAHLPLLCLHCEEAPCMAASENGAVYRREDGIVLIDPQKAEGQERIVHACPYRVISWNAEKRIPQKCTLCAHRLDEGEKQPRCVESCPTGALVFGDLDDPGSDIVKAMAGKQVEDFRPEFGTKPLVRYSGIPKKFVAGEVVFKDRQDECAAGVTVSLEGGGTRLATKTDIFGDFEFEGLENRTAYVLDIAHKGYAARKFEFTTMTDVNLGEIVLSPK